MDTINRKYVNDDDDQDVMPHGVLEKSFMNSVAEANHEWGDKWHYLQFLDRMGQFDWPNCGESISDPPTCAMGGRYSPPRSQSNGKSNFQNELTNQKFD